MPEIYEKFTHPQLPQGFFWYNEPQEFRVGNGLEIVTKPETDFWQRSHYGFRNDNGHFLFTELEGDFAISTQSIFEPQAKYDQCGLMIRLDAENWIKVSVEYEDEQVSRLGSVVTNLGYSDWATQDIASTTGEIWYKISKNGSDFLLENSFDGVNWFQMRITHLHQISSRVKAGIYACSPIGSMFRCKFASLVISENRWFHPA
ncbi:MAG: DUF1349 domain-containing protein [Anaerolineae bacterium]|nr:DUF1349 domain-containing protein [Anaerolineae bacterium]